jgi:hypothetical protein
MTFCEVLVLTQKLFVAKSAIKPKEQMAQAKLPRGLKVSFIYQVSQEKENEHN